MRKNRYKIEQSVVTTILEYDTENKSIYISTNEHDSPPMKWTHRHIREDLRTYSAHSIRVLSSLISSIFVCFFSLFPLYSIRNAWVFCLITHFQAVSWTK